MKSASVYSTEYPYGAVISQSPAAGSEIRSGGAVYVITSLGEEMARVPDVRYMELEEAKTTLMENGLSWRIRYVVREDVALGLVAEQKTPAGLKTPFGAAIELLVSAEKEGTETPDGAAIDITPKTKRLRTEETVKLDCSFSKKNKIIWASSNPYIAEVDENGEVTGRHFGSVTITAAVDGNVAAAVITVTDESVLKDTGEYVLETGETVSLASEIPESILPEVVWRSSNPFAAFVDEKGTVTALAEGYTDITAVWKGQTVVCGITVNQKIEYVKFLKSTLLKKLSTAEQALAAKGFEYEVVDEFSDTSPWEPR